MAENYLKLTAILIVPLFSIGTYLSNENEVADKVIYNKNITYNEALDETNFFDVVTGENILDFKKDKLETKNAEVKEVSDEVEIKSKEVEEKNEIIKKTATSSNKQASSRIGVSGPILSEIKIVNGKNMCKDVNDKPRESKKTSKVHVDAECCLDPDEIPNSNCYYSPEKYGSLINKYLRGKK